MQSHNEAGHINAFIKDHDSAHTGYGMHDRVVAFQPNNEGLYIRIDHKWKLGMPTMEQVLIAARKTQNIKGEWKFSYSEMWDDETSTDMYFTKGYLTCKPSPASARLSSIWVQALNLQRQLSIANNGLSRTSSK